MDIQNEIIQTIDLMIEKRLGDKNLPRMVQSVVVGSGTKGYLCSINGIEYSIPCSSGLNLTPGTSVWVCIPYGDIKKAFIIGTNGKGGESGVKVVDEYSPSSHDAISGMGVADAFNDLHETVNLTFADW